MSELNAGIRWCKRRWKVAFLWSGNEIRIPNGGSTAKEWRLVDWIFTEKKASIQSKTTNTSTYSIRAQVEQEIKNFASSGSIGTLVPRTSRAEQKAIMRRTPRTSFIGIFIILRSETSSATVQDYRGLGMLPSLHVARIYINFHWKMSGDRWNRNTQWSIKPSFDRISMPIHSQYK